ncbi:MAG: hypothetical protein WB646_01720 [Steroidobacteraceae bacterium]
MISTSRPEVYRAEVHARDETPTQNQRVAVDGALLSSREPLIAT